MVIVLISVRYKSLLELIMHHNHQNIHSIQVIKRDGGKVFLYIDTTLSQENVIRYLHGFIQKKCYGAIVYEFYGIYNGKIDFHSYLSDESKNKIKYYQTKGKDITSQEIELYLKERL
ncbi:MAG: hypothetical protein RR630_02740 [Coprobacillus sp.]